MKRRYLALVLALAAWDPFRSPNKDVEDGNRAAAEGRWDDALAAYDRASHDPSVDPDGLAYNRGTAELAKAKQAADPKDKQALTD
ncbi:MAG TPA: hypothetical protein VLT45_06860, partial [Kofleriaceae bacterium]|nr:hypothetical protein [Kofleriaceae bacterium]